jgi:hypothetical protein
MSTTQLPFRVLHRAAAALLAACALPVMAQLPVVMGEPAVAPKVAPPAAELRLAGDAAQPRGPAAVALSPVTDSELAVLRETNSAQHPQTLVKRVLIGVVRNADATPVLPTAADLEWSPVAGGYAARMALTSPAAAALRVSLSLAGVPGDVEMVFFGSGDPTHLVGPVKVADVTDRSQAWWSPVTEGETQTIEFFAPGTADPRALPIAASAVSHLLAGPSSRFEKRVSEIGDAGSCNVDAPCSSLESSQAFQDATNAVAQMVINDGQFVALCTGTLLNDTDTSTQIPWFFSANHCFDNESPPYKTPAQMQVVANTLDTLWFFRASSCNSDKVSAAYRDLPSGATYVYNDTATDILFLRLNAAPPQGAFFAGWNANTLTSGAGVVALTYPEGDLLKVSQGTMQGFVTPAPAPVNAGVNKFIGIQWSSGTTEPGSSGGGIFTNTGGQYVLRGALWGGGASCQSPAGIDIFSRFDLAYSKLVQYLSPTASPSGDFTDLWWNPNESGWGLNIVEHATRVIFAVWYTYNPDRTPTWYVLPSGTWTSANVYSGTLYAVTGPPFTTAFNPSLVNQVAVGTATLSFVDSNNGTWTYSVNGVSGSKSITRQPY